MDINKFVELELKESKKLVPAYLTLPGYLHEAIKTTKTESETAVLEMGNCLSWNSILGQLALDTPTVTGKFDALDLKLPDSSGQLGFIGTYHNHPYEKRYGPNYALGPSSGDWLGWSRYFPVHYGISVNIVTSGKRVFVALLLEKTGAKPSSDHGDIDQFEELRHTHITSDLDRVVVYGEAIQDKKWNVEKKFYQDILNTKKVDLPRTHQLDVMQMNMSYAVKNPGFALYSGSLEDSVCRVELLEHHHGLKLMDNIQATDTHACYSCRQRRTHDNPSYFSQWHRCPKCKAVFCPQHGKALTGNQLFSRARNCEACDTRTLLF
ncbi:MAG: hypothetical protein LBJ37_16385 [Paucimonas sp.]|jgi:hypothetical protein|nr:hypothetical protein [Paucimonas sp.]